MRLVGKTHRLRRVRQRQAAAQQHPRARHAPAAQPRLRRQPVTPRKLLDQRGPMTILRLRQRLLAPPTNRRASDVRTAIARIAWPTAGLRASAIVVF
ncbi:hypothetical protein A7J67_00845 [Achromobacter xylosoxidans]|nr:hypothetical protein A7J67_00845 [Achromobacter xylosoxidans]